MDDLIDLMKDAKSISIFQIARNSYGTNKPWTLRFKLDAEESMWTGETYEEVIDKAKADILAFLEKSNGHSSS